MLRARAPRSVGTLALWCAAWVALAARGVRGANNCLACVRCGGTWAVTRSNGTAYAQCLMPPAAGALDGSMYGGLLQAQNCTGGAPSQYNGELECPSICGPDGPCPIGNRCGECLFAKSNTQCVTPEAPEYPYNSNVRAVCNTIAAAGFPLATNAALVYGMSLPWCDCPAAQTYSTDPVKCGSSVGSSGATAAAAFSSSFSA